MSRNWVYGSQDMQYAAYVIQETNAEQTSIIIFDDHRIT